MGESCQRTRVAFRGTRTSPYRRKIGRKGYRTNLALVGAYLMLLSLGLSVALLATTASAAFISNGNGGVTETFDGTIRDLTSWTDT